MQRLQFAAFFAPDRRRLAAVAAEPAVEQASTSASRLRERRSLPDRRSGRLGERRGLRQPRLRAPRNLSPLQ